MKYMKNKKKNSKKDHTSNKPKSIYEEFKNSIIFDFDTQTINGISIQELEDKLIRRIPNGFYALCYRCDPPKLLTKEQALDHDLLIHKIKR